MRRRTVLPLLAVLLAAGCGGPPAAPTSPGAVTEGVFDIRGTVVSVDAARPLVEINQESIPGLMPSMTMIYAVADPAILSGIGAGDRVEGTLRVDSRGYVITSLRRS